ncbi:hypothetical protein PTSG_06728 [Salpingoeca rosetta]|uniref:Uncharacterized protein n=1 Tax=Salpingoeca rosetta (strain ATCC 50818 / BSB-021) TaxID=946362 RepID=F2UEM1_SALR5|nr:uncharacterized protein PTSG_06728 [Salpingoeca rosetta]EGD75071.1 hypothetical protein PTSG_06728 [Salpingoeca rosetta]|eukprot:XP_004992124.1 hypothetical protein PTSG_06728 [Salpingoeca rosetta]
MAKIPAKTFAALTGADMKGVGDGVGGEGAMDVRDDAEQLQAADVSDGNENGSVLADGQQKRDVSVEQQHGSETDQEQAVGDGDDDGDDAGDDGSGDDGSDDSAAEDLLAALPALVNQMEMEVSVYHEEIQQLREENGALQAALRLHQNQKREGGTNQEGTGHHTRGDEDVCQQCTVLKGELARATHAAQNKSVDLLEKLQDARKEIKKLQESLHDQAAQHQKQARALRAEMEKQAQERVDTEKRVQANLQQRLTNLEQDKEAMRLVCKRATAGLWSSTSGAIQGYSPIGQFEKIIHKQEYEDKIRRLSRLSSQSSGNPDMYRKKITALKRAHAQELMKLRRQLKRG